MQMMKSSIKTQGRTYLLCFFISLIGIACRMAYCVRYPVQPRDAYTYEQLIRNWEKTGLLSDAFVGIPFSLWILKAPYHFFRFDISKSGIAINCLLGILIIIISIIIADELFKNTYISFLSGLVFATHPILVRFSCSFLRENLYLFFTMMSILTAVKYYKSVGIKY